jgi:4-amino-4-deoxy-L-arabinose transferase-like glycosyltransferase
MYLYLLFIGAFLLRLINLDQSLWLDEAVVAKVVRTIPFHLIPTQFSPGDFHPPLYYLFMAGWSALVGTTEIALRMPSVLFSLVAGWFVYRIGAELKNKSVGMWSATFFLLNPLVVYYSQEARMYMMATMFLSVALYFFIRLMKTAEHPKSNAQHILLFNLFSALAIATFYGSVFFITALAVAHFFFLSKRRNLSAILTMTPWYIGVISVLILLAPLLLKQLDTAHVGLNVVKNWSLVLGKAEVKNVFMVFIKFTSGRLSWYPKLSYYAVAGIWAVISGMYIVRGSLKHTLLGFLFVAPLVLGLIVSFWSPMMQYFRFLYLIVPMSILLGLTISQTKGIRELFTIGFLIFSLVYLLLPQFHREEWKEMVKHLDAKAPVYMILPSSDPVLYYRNDLTLYELRDVQKMQLPETIQVIPYVEEVYGYSHFDILIRKGCLKIEENIFPGPVIFETWKCLRNA